MRISLHLRFPALVAIAALALAGCNSSSSDGDGSIVLPPQTGTVGIMITDAPTDEFDQILITVEEVRLLGGNGNDDYLMFEGSETFDLLALTEFTDLFTVSDDVPVGEYEKIRLQVSGIELVELDDNGDVVRTEDVRPRGNGKLDLSPRGSFNVEADETLLVRLDIDARKSILLVGAGASGQYILRPVVFVDIDRGELRDRLVRLYGEVEAVEADEITLCNLRRIQSEQGRRIVWLTSLPKGLEVYPFDVGPVEPLLEGVPFEYPTVVHSSRGRSFAERSNQRTFALHVWREE